MSSRVFDLQERVDASRELFDQEPSNYVQIWYEQPLTSKMNKYDETLCIKVPEGPFPDWIKPFFGSGGIRRIQTRQCPDYGFITASYTASAPST